MLYWGAGSVVGLFAGKVKGTLAMRNKQGKAKKKRLKELGLVQKSSYFYVQPDGDKEVRKRAITAIHAYRMLMQQLAYIATIAQAAGSTLTHKAGNVRIKPWSEKSKAVLAALFECAPGKAIYYELRGYVMDIFNTWRENGVVDFSSHVWDNMRRGLAALRDKEMPDLKKIPRSILVAAGVLDPVKVTNIGLPILATRQKNVELRAVRAIEDERGKRFRLKWGKGEASQIDFIVEGMWVGRGGKPWLKTPPPSIRHQFHKLASGEWPMGTVTLNIDRKGRFNVQVPNVRVAKRAAGLRPKSRLDLNFEVIMGRDLPKQKNSTSADDDKVFVVHGFAGTQHVLKIPVNDVVHDMDRIIKRREHLELRRDCRRRWPNSAKRPIADVLGGLTRLRTKQEGNANHAWTKEIVRVAAMRRCSIIEVHAMPDGTKRGLLLDARYPWQWAQFKKFLKQKAEEAGMRVRFAEDDAVAAILADEIAPTPAELVGVTTG